MIALFLTRDLMFQPKVSAAAKQHDAEVFAGGSFATLKSRCPQFAEASLLIIDLNLPGISVEQVIAEAKQELPVAKIVAYGPHVHVDLLSQARQFGCDAVLTRGQFEANMAAIFRM